MGEERHTNGAEKSQSGSGTYFPAQLTERSRQLRDDAQNLASHVSEAGGELQSYVTEAVRERPLGTLAVAAGVGFVLGGGLSSRLAALALGMGTRFAMAMAAREMSQWTLQPAGGGPRRESRGSQSSSRSQQGGSASSR